MSEDKQCLLRDSTEGRCLEEACGKNMLDECTFSCLAMIETGNECQLSAQLLLLSNDVFVVGCTKVLFLPSFSLSCSTCCLRNMRRTTHWLRNGMGEQSTLRITKPDTAQSERTLVRLIDTSSLIARLYQAKGEKTVLHTIHGLIVSSCVVFSRVPRTTHMVHFGFTLRAW